MKERSYQILIVPKRDVYIHSLLRIFLFWNTSIKVGSNYLDLRYFLSLYFIHFFWCNNVTSLLHSVGVAMLYPGSWIELMRFLYSIKPDSIIPIKLKFKLCSVISVESFSMWKGSEEMFKWKNDRCLSERCHFIGLVILAADHIRFGVIHRIIQFIN